MIQPTRGPAKNWSSPGALNSLRLPRLLVTFRNTASEKVHFWVEWTHDGEPQPPDFGERTSCPGPGVEVRVCARPYLFKPAYGTGRGQPKTDTREHAFDLAFVHCSSAAQYVEHLDGVPKILDFGDMDSQKWLEYARTRAFPLTLGYLLEGRKLERAKLKAKINREVVDAKKESARIDRLTDEQVDEELSQWDR